MWAAFILALFARLWPASQRRCPNRYQAIKARKQTRIPSVWTQDNVAKLLDAIDRGNPAGKRDYAIILLVTRLGLRTIDNQALRLSNLKWQDNRIELIQSKTATTLNLPLLPDVGWAIIDYLKNGRPKVESPFVFCDTLHPWCLFRMKTGCTRLSSNTCG